VKGSHNASSSDRSRTSVGVDMACISGAGGEWGADDK
jgi:hypothetical protein